VVPLHNGVLVDKVIGVIKKLTPGVAQEDNPHGRVQILRDFYLVQRLGWTMNTKKECVVGLL
jgi:hypothetical protein